MNNSNHPEPIRGNGNASRAHQVPFTTPLPVDHLLGKLFKYLTRCGRGARAVRILPPGIPWTWGLTTNHMLVNHGIGSGVELESYICASLFADGGLSQASSNM